MILLAIILFAIGVVLGIGFHIRYIKRLKPSGVLHIDKSSKEIYLELFEELDEVSTKKTVIFSVNSHK